ncbi:hypothetical protein [Streptomyces telluris]|uniref:DUF4185 domain-containing protein n=1 Tax=Streptomyces telluris TaxID=2720021 RepID=A0A9X2RPB5_9ACTN|nr:hypothetical protein [Streptomyces telluris]MCQ8772904.1 DUF4185 domain-containing protein [Streptomyces telluris]NJP80403.1 hypothetical protein [Streptomyces telluris]
MRTFVVKKYAAAAVLSVLCALLPPESAAPAAGPPRVVDARPAGTLNTAFGTYADHDRSPHHWTGGDSTYSVPTPAGELWVFSDTFLGTVRPDGSRSPTVGEGGTTPFLNNSFVLWTGSGPRTVTGRDRAGQPASPVTGPDRESWYWARAGIPDGHGVSVVYARYARTGSGPLDIAWRGNVLARFRAGAYSRPASVTPLPSSAGIAWGAWLEPGQGGYTYVYGTERTPEGRSHLRLARVAGRDLRRPWQYWTARGAWSGREEDAGRLAGPGGPLFTSDEVSVVRHGSWYALVTQRADLAFSAETQIAWSRSPAGPFTRPRTVYTAPEAGPNGTYRNPNVIAYNPHEHPELERGRRDIVISYNVNSLVPADVIRRADIYRPRFLRLTLAPY